MSKLYCLVGFLLVVASSCVIAETELSSEQFLQRVRKPSGRESWAMLEGAAQNKRSDGQVRKAKIYVGITFTGERTLAQVIIDGREGYRVGQVYGAGEDNTSVIPMQKEKKEPLLHQFGLRPEDLAMTFLYWNFLKELDKDSIGFRACRVFVLQSPDKKERVKVYVDEKGYFPRRVEWYAEGQKLSEKSERRMEVDSVREVNKLYVVSALLLCGPGWQTKIKFTDIKAGLTKDSHPKDLFRPLSVAGDEDTDKPADKPVKQDQ